MKKLITILSLFMLSSCSSKANINELEWNFPNCGTSLLNNQSIIKVCATRDYIANAPQKRKKDWLAFLAAEGSSGYKGSRESVGGILEFQNQELNFKGHVWDFSKQGFPIVVFRGHDTIVQNGILLNTYVSLGGNYIPPNFTTGEQKNNLSIKENGFLYAKEYSSGAYQGSIENFYFKNMKNHSDTLDLSSWGGGILSSQFIIENYIYIAGSKATIIANQIISKAKSFNDKPLFTLQKQNFSTLIDFSKQIFPDQADDKTAIPSTLYVKFSPDTIIDSNTFTLTQRNDQAYAIVLDHSPRVRITNNTFNGFKVPILMDQWSSIVDEKGNEIKHENFTGYGNLINPDKFAGNVTMNRKGEIVINN
ncbi:hypothetical protein [Acinetobacter bouvetii]|uniref:Right-handed parallel beta-helix repeat-containing protein n=1 Tax=Acinetobacter bouvetii TaxID=202951 RepID=A0A811GAG9_9GAMM|nr:hypothetical protein [Acinetobacter bouvetii]CAB1211135.1 hypothetical protein SFB21_0905 [Acinetobacter bouvetii]